MFKALEGLAKCVALIKVVMVKWQNALEFAQVIYIRYHQS